MILGVLLYAAGTWPTKQKDIRRWFGMPPSLEVTITCRRLQWLGHVTWKDNLRLPRSFCLDGYFICLLPTSPASCPQRQATEEVRRDLKTFHINENTWYMIGRVGCSNTLGEPHWCQWTYQATTVTVFVAA